MMDGYLNEEEFRNLLLDLFCDSGHSYALSRDMLKEFIKLLDEDKDGKLSKKEFTEVCFYWLKQILRPVSVLVIIDVQNDFLLGSLALRNCPAGQDGMGVLPAINSVLDTVNFDLVVYTRDWHPSDHISFIDNFVDGGVVVDKGTHSDVDSYSAFWDNNKSSQTELVSILSKYKVTDVYLCGVAYDVCVGQGHHGSTRQTFIDGITIR
ncbi:hypothetical protein KUTeg_024607 [Tegillarca granosa]|uniref:nicotinamidase n=1 Tax=Tegillarca granosa TaxID=220873 RepID=A0ABQ9E2Y4_TEGGR|nr:hypothetical protein KUTeg_024607 [Tegillarca granosa]